MRIVLLLLFTASVSAGEIAGIPSPAGAGALGPSLTAGPDGTVYLSWLEPAEADAWALKFSRFEAESMRWTAARTIAQGAGWFVNWADFPQLAVQDGRMTAVWFVENPPAEGRAGHHGSGYHAVLSESADGGATWRPARPVSRESAAVEFVALLPQSRGLLAAWLDGRQRSKGVDRQALYARASGDAPQPDQLVDDSVCDCCQLALLQLTGGALLAYRGRTGDEVRDIRLARYHHGRWEVPRTLHDDGWKIAGCPVNGPRLAAHGDTVAAAWFTGAGDQPRVQVKISRDGGATFGEAVRVDLGRPQGRVDCAVTGDGAALVTWLETTGEAVRGGVYARRITAAGEVSPPHMLAATKTTRASGFPRIALLPGDKSGRYVLACTRDENPSRVSLLLVTPAPEQAPSAHEP